VYTFARAPLAERLLDGSLTIRDEQGHWSEAFALVRRTLDLPGAAFESACCRDDGSALG
jgi:hypothetical protein